MLLSLYHEMTVFCVLITSMIWSSAIVTKRSAGRSYFALTTAIFIFTVVDAVWGLIGTNRISSTRPVTYAVLDLYFFLMVFSIVTLAHYFVGNFQTARLVHTFEFVFLGMLLLTTLLLLLNHFTGILFQITDTAAYHCGTAISILYFVTLFLYTVMFFPVLNTKSEIRERIMYFVTYLLPVAFMFLQFVFPALPFFSMALTLSLVGITLTQEYQLRKLLVDALNTAEHANRAKTAFLNNMSHDIRTPMNAIIGFTALAAAHVNQPDQVQEYLNKISTSGQHLLSLINDVLDMSRIESGRVKIEEKEVHLPDVMHDLRTIVNASIVSKNIEFFIDAVDVKNEDILCDKLRLNQILLNLLSNATKFTQNGGTIIVRIIQKPYYKKGYALYEFHVRDNGIGMSREFQEHLFESFTREETSTVSGIQGTGLGMAITKNIVDMMGGTISVESEEGKGTEYTVSIPFQVLASSARYEIIPQLQGVRVLVADDDSNTAISVSHMVQEIGMVAEWTLSGKEAVLRTKVAVEQNREFGAYIIDWMMPDLNGIETVRRIRQIIGDSRPIIILTAYDWSDIEQEAKEAGVTAFCSKPLFLSELRDVLSRPYKTDPAAAAPLAPKYNFCGKKVLLVEDNRLNQEIAMELLSNAGFSVSLADDGDVAVETLRTAAPDQFDLVLMDIQMPKLDGYSATRQIRTLDGAIANIPIIAMTANAFEEDKQKAFAAGMNAHIAKPIEVDSLLSTIAKVLG